MFMLNELLIKELSNQVETNASEIQNIKDGEIYSTSEIKTNKKYNKNGIIKDVYRRDIYYVVSGTTTTSLSYINIDEITDYDSICYRNGNNLDVEKPYYISSSDYFRSFLRRNGESYQIETRITIAQTYTEYLIKTTIEYTKATDQTSL